jgi:polyhydroxyalkanoate synthesis regulator phasin
MHPGATKRCPVASPIHGFSVAARDREAVSLSIFKETGLFMLEAIKQSIFTGIGAASLTQEKITEVVQELAKHLPLTEQQAKDFREEITRRSETARKELGQQIDTQIDHAFIQAGLAKNELRRAAESTSGVITQLIDERIQAAFEGMGVARTEDIDALKHRIELLEKHLSGPK